MRVIGIVGDADVYCLECACRYYGHCKVSAAVVGLWNGEPVDAYNGYGPKDGEGNVLGVVFEAESIPGETCGVCFVELAS